MPVTEPFILEPSLAERVWGGGRFGPGIGEAWDLSTHPNGHSIVASGVHAGRTLADVVRDHPEVFGGPIDLLAKRLDCAENLSVQVHPSEGDPKTEAWVVLEARPGAGVFLGLREELSRSEVAAAARGGSLEQHLSFVPLRRGEAVFVPAGTVHAIGAGLVLFELQQSSDTTYRLYDWGRTGRELHLDEGLASARLGPAPATPEPVRLAGGGHRLVSCDYFFIDGIGFEPTDGVAPDRKVSWLLDPAGRWIALHVVEGSAALGSLEVRAGETALVPQGAGAVAAALAPGSVALRYGPAQAAGRT